MGTSTNNVLRRWYVTLDLLAVDNEEVMSNGRH